MKILIVKLSALGDVVHALPVLDYIRQVAPEAQVDWVVEAANRAVLDDNPLLRQIIPVELKKWRKQPLRGLTRQQVLATVRQLRHERYDLVFDLQGNIKSGIITRLSGAPRRFGFDRQAVRETPNLWATTDHVALRPEDFHVSARSLRVVSAAFGIEYGPLQLASEIVTSLADETVAARCLPSEAPLILFHTGTTWVTKRWHVEGWQQLGELLLADYPDHRIVFSWANEEEYAEAQLLAERLGDRVSVLPRISIKEFCAVLKQVCVVVGGDTGPIHLAAAVGTPTVSFYRATDPRRNAPLGEQHRRIEAGQPCIHCLQKSCERDDVCRRSVDVTLLHNAVRGLIG